MIQNSNTSNKISEEKADDKEKKGENEMETDDDNEEDSETTQTISTETNDPCEIFRNKISRAVWQRTTLRTDLPTSSDNSYFQDQTDHTELAHKFTTLRTGREKGQLEG